MLACMYAEPGRRMPDDIAVKNRDAAPPRVARMKALAGRARRPRRGLKRHVEVLNGGSSGGKVARLEQRLE